MSQKKEKRNGAKAMSVAVMKWKELKYLVLGASTAQAQLKHSSRSKAPDMTSNSSIWNIRTQLVQSLSAACGGKQLERLRTRSSQSKMMKYQ